MKASSGSSREPQGQQERAGRFGRMRRWLARLALRLAQRLTERLARSLTERLEPASDTAAKDRFADAPAAWRRVLAAADPTLLNDGKSWQSFRTSDWAAPGEFPGAPSSAPAAPAPLPAAEALQRQTPEAYRPAGPRSAAPRADGRRPTTGATAAAPADGDGASGQPHGVPERPAAVGPAVSGSTAAAWPAAPPFRPGPRFLDRPHPPAAPGRAADVRPADAQPADPRQADVRPADPQPAAVRPAAALPRIVESREPSPPRHPPEAQPRRAAPGTAPAAGAPPAQAGPAEARPVREQSGRPTPDRAMPALPPRQAPPAPTGPILRQAPAAGRRAGFTPPTRAAAPERPPAPGHAASAARAAEAGAQARLAAAGPERHETSPWPTLPPRHERPGGGRPVGRGLRDDFAARGTSEAGRGTWTG